MLDKLAESLPPERVQKLERDLSLQNDQTRGAEWEVAIGSALSEIGDLKDFGNSEHGNPDFIWEPQDKPVIVEVTCVSDIGLHEQNPVQPFLNELGRLSDKYGISHFGTFDYEFGSAENETKVTIAIPDKQTLARFFACSEMKVFFEKIRREPTTGHTLEFSERGATSRITFRPSGQHFSGGSYRNYTAPKSVRHSPVFNALASKERQIRKSGQTLPAILFICDNDCYALQPSVSRVLGQVPMRDIVGMFLNGQERRTAGNFIWQEGIPAQAKHIHAVIWVAVSQESGVFAGSARRLAASIEYADFADPYLRTQEFVQFLNSALTTLPFPQTMPCNVTHGSKYPWFYGEVRMTDKEIRISALTLQKLLSGEITYQEFERDYAELVAHVRRLDAQGMMIDKIAIEQCESEDDDWVSFRFDGINPKTLFSKK